MRRLTMKCPICYRELPDDAERCTLCGFNQFHKEFLNRADYERWMEETVAPCKIVGQTLLKQLIDETKRKTETLKNWGEALKRQNELKDEVIRLNRQILEMKKSQDGKETPVTTSSKTILYPETSHIICYDNWSQCEINNVKIDITGTTASVSFLLKKTFDYKGNNGLTNVGVGWQLKDEDGVIISSNKTWFEKMSIGDIVKHTIRFYNIDANKQYTLKFVNYS